MNVDAYGFCYGDEIELDDLVLINLVAYKIIGFGDETRQTITLRARNLTTGAEEYPVIRADETYDLLREV